MDTSKGNQFKATLLFVQHNWSNKTYNANHTESRCMISVYIYTVCKETNNLPLKGATTRVFADIDECHYL